MAGNADMFALLEEMLESGRTPEEVCRDRPDLLPEVRQRWQAIRLVDGSLAALFPDPPTRPGTDVAVAVPRPAELPQVPGYRVEALLGRGGMGVVYRAWHLRLGRAVALKMLLAGPGARSEELQRFQRETEAVASLRHANIVQVYDAGDVDGRPYFTMELIEGANLAEQVQGAPQPAGQAAALVATLADAIQAAHQGGIVHRDLKPGNVLLTGDGTPKVSDFGLARRLEGGGGLTLSGTPVGTPSYMAPEQARGDRRAIGPATDVYALGAILYELLTGRPPFCAETGAATLQQVMADEPVPPARLNPRVPRDLETICLKCLNKVPGRRYSSARELADDLRRFLNDEPIRARPPGRWERGWRWLRHRPALAVGLAAAVLLAVCLVGGEWWLSRQRAAQAQGVEDDLQEATLRQEKFAWAEAAAALERAKGRLSAGGPAELHRRVEQAAHSLDQARRDASLAARLEAIRLKRATHIEGYFNSASERRWTNARADRDYEEAFRQAGFEEVGKDPAAAAARVRESVVREALVTGLTDWAVCAVAPDHQDWLLVVARQADPGAWSDCVRDPAAWRDGAALAALAKATPITQQATPLRIALAERVQATGGDALGVLRQVRQEHPDDFWANLVSGKVLREEGKPEEAAACYRQALQIRPEAAAFNNRGLALYDVHVRAGDGIWDEAIACFQKVLDQNPLSAPAHNNLGVVLKIRGDWDNAVEHFRLALQLDLGSAPAHCNLGVITAYRGVPHEAIEHFREALRLDPRCALAHYHLGVVLLGKDRFDTSWDNYQRALRDDDPKNREADGGIYREAFIHALDHYHRAIDFDPGWALTPGALGLTLEDQRGLAEALDHYDRALGCDPQLAVAEGARGQVLLARGRFREARTATRRCLELLAQDSCRIEPSASRNLRRNMPGQLLRCERLLALEQRLPAILRQEEKPPAEECLEFAELCAMKGRYAAAAGLYADAFAAAPHLGEEPAAGRRYNAACAAALAGFGHGADAAGLSEAERARWRRQARTWLRADVAAWTRKLDTGVPPDHDLVRKVSARWWADPGLTWLRDAGVVEGLPPGERQECLALWQDAGAVLRRAETTR
jgi:serine/threonine-protein kinase